MEIPRNLLEKKERKLTTITLEEFNAKVNVLACNSL